MVWAWAPAVLSRDLIAPATTAGQLQHHKFFLFIFNFSIFTRCDLGFIHCVKHGAVSYHHGLGKTFVQVAERLFNYFTKFGKNNGKIVLFLR